jgi:hypothetical protein
VRWTLNFGHRASEAWLAGLRAGSLALVLAMLAGVVLALRWLVHHYHAQ